MVTQVIFKIEPKLKNQAIRKAKREGTTYSSVLKFATRAYVKGDFRVGLVRENELPNAKTARELDQMDRDIKAGRNLSPGFDNAQDMIAYLKRETGRQ